MSTPASRVPATESAAESTPLRFVTAASLFDGHDAAINIMRRLIQSQGAEVVHLGHNRAVEDVVRAALQEDADGIAVSSYQGGHVEYFKYMIDMLRERNAGHIRVFGGGGGTITPEEIAELQAYGVERIYHPNDGMHMGLVAMIEDVVRRTTTARAKRRTALVGARSARDQPAASNETPVAPKGRSYKGSDDASVGAAEAATRDYTPTKTLASATMSDEISVGHALSAIENGLLSDQELTHLRKQWHLAGSRTPVIGLTGTGGAGKSSVTDELLIRFLASFPGMRIAVISVDPTRRRTGGALLGDRIRMNALRSMRVFMRSMATRRQHVATNIVLKDCIAYLRSLGYDLVMVETAGIGQSDSEIVDLVDFPVYVMTSDYGAASQLEKIDMIDYAELIVLNKYDRRGAEDALRDVRKQWKRNRTAFKLKDEDVPVYATIASQFNDPGVTWMFTNLCRLVRTKLHLDDDSGTPVAASAAPTSTPNAPPAPSVVAASAAPTSAPNASPTPSVVAANAAPTRASNDPSMPNVGAALAATTAPPSSKYPAIPALVGAAEAATPPTALMGAAEVATRPTALVGAAEAATRAHPSTTDASAPALVGTAEATTRPTALVGAAEAATRAHPSTADSATPAVLGAAEVATRPTALVGAAEAATRAPRRCDWTPHLDTTLKEPRATILIPGARVRYLAEIAESGRSANKTAESQAETASRAQSYHDTLRDLADPALPKPLDPYPQEALTAPVGAHSVGDPPSHPSEAPIAHGVGSYKNPAHQSTPVGAALAATTPRSNETPVGAALAATTPTIDRSLLTLRQRYNEAIKSLSTDSLHLLKEWPTRYKAIHDPVNEYKVRDKTIKVENYRDSLSHQKIPKIAPPTYRDWGDLLKFLHKENLPGGYPYTAGVFPYRRTGEDPTRMFAGEGTPERTNRRFHYLSLGQEAARLSTAFDSVTLYGEDPHPRPDIFGKIGNSGVNIPTLDDMKKLYSGFDLCQHNTSVSMTINGPAPIILSMFMNTAIDQQVEKYLREDSTRWDAAHATIEKVYAGRKRPQYHGPLPEGNDGLGLGLLGVTGDQVVDAETYARIKTHTLHTVRGTVQADIFKEDQAQNTCIFSTEFALRMMGDIQQYFVQHKVRNFYSVSISGYHIAEAGANPISQLAFTLSNGFTIVEYYLARGMKIDDFAPNLSFFFSNGMDPEYTVIGRVARRIWARAMKERYGASPRSQMLKYHIQTSGRSLHAQEIQFNDIRTTLQALYALFDNCNSLHTNAYDEAITTPTEESVRRAVAIQLIINRELGLNFCENPWQGSFIAEALTDLVEEAVYKEFEAISERGGVLGAMDTMYQRGKIQEESMYYEQKKHDGTLPLIGVNTYLPKEHAGDITTTIELIRSTESEKQQQISNVESFRVNRNAALALALVGAAEAATRTPNPTTPTPTSAPPGSLPHLQSTARARTNIFEALIEAVKYNSLGQISHALYDVGGEYRRNM